MPTPKGMNGEQAKDRNITNFQEYWEERKSKRGNPGDHDPAVFIAEGYLPLKANGEVWVSRVAEEAQVGLRAMTGQNPELHALYESAKAETLAAYRKAVEERLAAGSRQATTPDQDAGDALRVPDGVPELLMERFRRLQQRNSTLEQMVGELTVSRDKALVDRNEAIEERDKARAELDRLRLQFAQNEFKYDQGMNPGPY